jgi:hypothetical protein
MLSRRFQWLQMGLLFALLLGHAPLSFAKGPPRLRHVIIRRKTALRPSTWSYAGETS